jgi:polyhydroxyalkanoate synthesis regulator phasin
MSEPADMVLPLLREMCAEIATLRGEVGEGFSTMERRFAALEAAQVSFRQALGADSLLSKLVTGEFEERIEALERRVRQLEGQH